MTFNVSNRNLHLVILAVEVDKILVPSFAAITETKDKPTYMFLLRWLKQHYPLYRPGQVFVDFEVAISSSFNEVYGVDPKGLRIDFTFCRPICGGSKPTFQKLIGTKEWRL